MSFDMSSNSPYNHVQHTESSTQDISSPSQDILWHAQPSDHYIRDQGNHASPVGSTTGGAPTAASAADLTATSPYGGQRNANLPTMNHDSIANIHGYSYPQDQYGDGYVPMQYGGAYVQPSHGQGLNYFSYGAHAPQPHAMHPGVIESSRPAQQTFSGQGVHHVRGNLPGGLPAGVIDFGGVLIAPVQVFRQPPTQTMNINGILYAPMSARTQEALRRQQYMQYSSVRTGQTHQSSISQFQAQVPPRSMQHVSNSQLNGQVPQPQVVHEPSFYPRQQQTYPVSCHPQQIRHIHNNLSNGPQAITQRYQQIVPPAMSEHDQTRFQAYMQTQKISGQSRRVTNSQNNPQMPVARMNHMQQISERQDIPWQGLSADQIATIVKDLEEKQQREFKQARELTRLPGEKISAVLQPEGDRQGKNLMTPEQARSMYLDFEQQEHQQAPKEQIRQIEQNSRAQHDTQSSVCGDPRLNGPATLPKPLPVETPQPAHHLRPLQTPKSAHHPQSIQPPNFVPIEIDTHHRRHDSAVSDIPKGKKPTIGSQMGKFALTPAESKPTQPKVHFSSLNTVADHSSPINYLSSFPLNPLPKLLLPAPEAFPDYAKDTSFAELSDCTQRILPGTKYGLAPNYYPAAQVPVAMTSPIPELNFDTNPIHTVIPNPVDWEHLMADDSAMLIELSARCSKNQFIKSLEPLVTNVPPSCTNVVKTLSESLKNSRRLRNMFPLNFQAPRTKNVKGKSTVSTAVGDILCNLTDLQLLYRTLGVINFDDWSVTYGIQKVPLSEPKDLPTQLTAQIKAQGRAAPTVEMHFKANPDIMEHFRPGHRFLPHQAPLVNSRPAPPSIAPSRASNSRLPKLPDIPVTSRAGQKRKATNDDQEIDMRPKKSRVETDIAPPPTPNTVIIFIEDDILATSDSVNPQVSSPKRKRKADDVEDEDARAPDPKKARVEVQAHLPSPASPQPLLLSSTPISAQLPLSKPDSDPDPLDDKHKPMLPFTGSLSEQLCGTQFTGKAPDGFWKSVSSVPATENALEGLSCENKEILDSTVPDFSLLIGCNGSGCGICIECFLA